MQPVLAVRGDIDRKMLLAQRLGDFLREPAIVFDEKDFHAAWTSHAAYSRNLNPN